jgi:DNA-binding NarL/FixJ family response regulator
MQPAKRKKSSAAASRSAPVKIAFVDDHPTIRQGLALAFREEPGFTVCGEADSCEQTLALLQRDPPDVLLVDLSLSDGSGLELIKQIRARYPDVKMLVYSMHEEQLFAARVIRAGASGYVHKSESLDALMEAVWQVFRGRIHLSSAMTDKMLSRSLDGGGSERIPSPRDLSDRELEVFELIGHGKTTKQVADILHLSVKTIETHRENIKQKLDLASHVELLRAAFFWVLEQP